VTTGGRRIAADGRVFFGPGQKGGPGRFFGSGTNPFTRLLARDRAAAVAELRAVLAQTGGNVRRTAFLLGMDRAWLMKVLSRENLMVEVEAARERAARPEWLTRAQATTGDGDGRGDPGDRGGV
jgi:hypothetical protein